MTDTPTTPSTDDLIKRSAPLVFDRSHSHSTDAVVGYRVRQTIEAGKPLVKVGNLPTVLGTFAPHQYLDALECAREHRRNVYRIATNGRWRRRTLSDSEQHRAILRANPIWTFVTIADYAGVDPVYQCGCAWGDFDYMPSQSGDWAFPAQSLTTYDPSADPTVQHNMEVGRS